MDLDHGISWNNNSNQDFSQKLIKINFNAVTLCKKLEKFFASILKGPIFGPFCPKIPEKYFFSKNFDESLFKISGIQNKCDSKNQKSYVSSFGEKFQTNELHQY